MFTVENVDETVEPTSAFEHKAVSATLSLDSHQHSGSCCLGFATPDAQDFDDFILQAPGICPKCQAEVHERTLVELIDGAGLANIF